jgi:hypothetical protein
MDRESNHHEETRAPAPRREESERSARTLLLRKPREPCLGCSNFSATSFASSSLPAGHHSKHIRSVGNRTRAASRSGGGEMTCAGERSESVGRGRRRGRQRRRVGSPVGSSSTSSPSSHHRRRVLEEGREREETGNTGHNLVAGVRIWVGRRKGRTRAERRWVWEKGGGAGCSIWGVRKVAGRDASGYPMVFFGSAD